MSELETSGSSFLLAQEQHSAQREHTQHTQHTPHTEHIKHTHEQHSHQQFHRSPNVISGGHEWRHLPPIEEDMLMEKRHWGPEATDVVTISIIKEISVDTKGNTIGIKTIQTHLSEWDDLNWTNTAALPTATETLEASIPAEFTNTPTDLPQPSLPLPSESFLPSLPSLPVSTDLTTSALPIAPSELPASSTVAGIYPSIPGLSIASVQTATPSVPTTDFPSLSTDSNSTALISNSSSLSQTYTNSSSSTSTSSYLSSSRSSSLFKSSTKSSSSTSLVYSTQTYLPTAADGGAIAAGTGIAPGSETGTTTTSSAEDSNSNSSPTPTPVVIGGVVGSLAGAAVLIICLLYIIRWRKRGKGMLSLGSGNDGGDASRAQPAVQPSGDMAEQTSRGFAVPAALAALSGYSKRFSQKTEGTVSSTAASEKGFYRVSGRKLPSVLQTGGDGYGGGLPHDSTLSGTSFYSDSQGFYGGGPSSPPVPLSHRQSAGGIPFMRPSPARTPTQENSPFAFSESIPSPPPPRRPDALGRSHVSQDGSHASRFTEEV